MNSAKMKALAESIVKSALRGSENDPSPNEYALALAYLRATWREIRLVEAGDELKKYVRHSEVREALSAWDAAKEGK